MSNDMSTANEDIETIKLRHIVGI